MGSRTRHLLGALGVAGALLTLVEPRWRLALLRLAPIVAPVIGRRYVLGPRDAFLFAVGRLLDSPESALEANAPSLVRMLVEAAARAIGRVLAGRGRWGLRARHD